MRLSSRHRTAALLIQQGLHMCTKMPEIARQIPVSKLLPQMSNLMIDGSTKPQIFAEKTSIF
jgi:hypothetical protein